MSDPDVVELARRRGFFFQANEAYGGVAGFYTFGPRGAALKRNVEDAWRRQFVVREGHHEIESPTVVPEAVFEASGHLDTFDDMVVECPECGASHRADHLVEDASDVEDAESLPVADVEELLATCDVDCPTCRATLADEPVSGFNLMFETSIGPGSSRAGYLRPETAQGILVEFPRLKEYARNQLPFGVAQVGSGYRNEISPRRSLLRVREFTLAELQQFTAPDGDGPDLEPVADQTLRLYPADAQEREGECVELTVREALREDVVANEWLAYYLGRARRWFERVGVDPERLRFRQHRAGELAHYASACWDAEARLHGDWVEIAGFAFRADHDLSKHDAHSDERFTLFREYDEPKVVERPTVDPDMSYLGPEFGDVATDVADALEALVERDPAAFRSEDVTVEVDGETYAVPVEKTGFSVDEIRETGEHVTPHVVEPSIGIDRVVYGVLVHSLRRDEVGGEERTRLALPTAVAPTVAGVFPLTDGQADRARDLADRLTRRGIPATYDDSGSIGRRYRRQDEIGTPFCVTLDERTSDDERATVRERDSTAQVRVPVDDVPETLASLRAGETTFAAVSREYDDDRQ
ncbi:glycine--tRNA ligase [halophilic archaeon]|nr:glycine--tRNA ligase [halophilic archaeon]